MSVLRIVNRFLSNFDICLARRSMLYSWQTGDVVKVPKTSLPEGADEYLVTENPRLRELKARYMDFQSGASIAIVWTDEYVQSYDLQSFRGDNCYVWQTGDPNCAEINYCLTTFYVEKIDLLGVLEKSCEDGLFGVRTYTVGSRCVSRDLLDSALELNFLEKELSLSEIADLNILDIGAGYGRLAQRTENTFANLRKYICTDAVPESTFISEYHMQYRGLAGRVIVVPLDEIEKRLEEDDITLAVNIHSFSECSLDAIEWWISLVAAAGIPYFFIIPNASDHGGEKLALNSGEDFLYLLEKYGYKLLCKTPKYGDSMVQRYGVSPTYYYLFKRGE